MTTCSKTSHHWSNQVSPVDAHPLNPALLQLVQNVVLKAHHLNTFLVMFNLFNLNSFFKILNVNFIQGLSGSIRSILNLLSPWMDGMDQDGIVSSSVNWNHLNKLAVLVEQSCSTPYIQLHFYIN